MTFFLTFFLAFYTASILTFFLTFSLAFCLTYVLTFYLTFYLAVFLAFYLKFSEMCLGAGVPHSIRSWQYSVQVQEPSTVSGAGDMVCGSRRHPLHPELAE